MTDKTNTSVSNDCSLWSVLGSSAYQFGYFAYLLKQYKAECPFEEGSPEFDEWEDGWFDAFMDGESPLTIFDCWKEGLLV